MIEIEPLTQADPGRVQPLIREVIEAHPKDYVSGGGWQEDVVRAMGNLVPYGVQRLLDMLHVPNLKFESGEAEGNEAFVQPDRGLGW